MHRDSAIDLTVVYTDMLSIGEQTIDVESGTAPRWDNSNELKYKYHIETSLLRIYQLVIGLNAQHVVISGWYPRKHALLALLLRLSGVQIGLRADSTLIHNTSGLRGGMTARAMLKIWLCLHQVWHPVGTLSSNFFANLAACKKPQVFFPYSVDTDWFEQTSTRHGVERIANRKKLGFSEEDYVIIAVMKWAEREDPITLIRAFLRARATAPHIKLLLVGDGPLHDEVKSCMKDDSNNWFAPGFVKYSELPYYYSVADVFVHPAKSEPFGVSVQEALACGLPVILSDSVGSAEDFLRPGINGESFAAGDAEGLASLIVRFAFDERKTYLPMASIESARTRSYSATIAAFQQLLLIP